MCKSNERIRMVEHVLVPVDESERSREALAYAMEQFPNAEFTALHVLEGGQGDLGTFSGMTGDVPDEDRLSEAADSILEDARRLATEHGVTLHTDRGRGRPDRLIVRYADEDDVDLVAIGSHGRDGVARVLLGSVAEKVVRRSSVPVLVVR